MKNIRAVTIASWLVAFIACLWMAYELRSVFGFLLALAVGSIALTLFIRLEGLRADQENIKYRLEEMYEMLKWQDDRRDDKKPRTILHRCEACNNRYEGERCTFCGG
ncbi:MAG: hypothetical protein FWE06_07055 [Oscillospiraceae bacterium]|nr:hypothetical protein [Oscillospiraceae bacterium]